MLTRVCHRYTNTPFEPRRKWDFPRPVTGALFFPVRSAINNGLRTHSHRGGGIYPVMTPVEKNGKFLSKLLSHRHSFGLFHHPHKNRCCISKDCFSTLQCFGPSKAVAFRACLWPALGLLGAATTCSFIGCAPRCFRPCCSSAPALAFATSSYLCLSRAGLLLSIAALSLQHGSLVSSRCAAGVVDEDAEVGGDVSSQALIPVDGVSGE